MPGVMQHVPHFFRPDIQRSGQFMYVGLSTQILLEVIVDNDACYTGKVNNYVEVSSATVTAPSPISTVIRAP